MDSYEDCVIFLMAKAYQRAHGIMKEQLKDHGLTNVQQLILGALFLGDGQSAGEIGQRLTLDSATLSGTLDRMVEKGLITKETDPDDRRVVRVRLTAKARGLAPALNKAQDLANHEVLKPLSLEERLLFKRLLRDLR